MECCRLGKSPGLLCRDVLWRFRKELLKTTMKEKVEPLNTNRFVMMGRIQVKISANILLRKKKMASFQERINICLLFALLFQLVSFCPLV